MVVERRGGVTSMGSESMRYLWFGGAYRRVYDKSRGCRVR